MAVEIGDIVTVNYTAMFEDGSVFDSTYHGDHSHPISFKVGEGSIIKGFEDAILGMEVGEEKEFDVLPENGYGEKDENLIQSIPSGLFHDLKGLKEGMYVELSSDNGEIFPATILEITDDFVKVDLNHPLSGKKLHFKVKVEKIEKNK